MLGNSYTTREAKARYDDAMLDDNQQALAKAKRKRHPDAPDDYHFIPKSKHQGYRKRKGDHWVYWYPNAHRHEVHLDWEPDLAAGIGTGGIKAGQFVAKVGSPGTIYAWTPDADAPPAKEKHTWITPINPETGEIHGAPVQVASASLQPQRSFDPEARRKRRQSKKKKEARWQHRHDPEKLAQRAKRQADPSHRTPGSERIEAERRRKQERADLVARIAEAEEMLARTGRRKLRSPDRIAALRAAIVDGREELKRLGSASLVGKLTDAPTEEARTITYEDSTAKKGTFLHKLENGHYPLIEFHGGDGHYRNNRKSHGVFVPPQDVPGVFAEFSDVITNPARKVARTYGISNEPDRADVESGAKLGFMMALRSYTGGTPFEVHARRYATVYATMAAREAKGGGGAAIPAQQMQMLHGLIAARARATAETGSANPTAEQIAKTWDITKGQTFTGRATTLGSYAHPTKKQRAPRTAKQKKKGEKGKVLGPAVIDQGKEQVPLESWQVLDPTGKPKGKKYPGKLTLIAEMTPIIEGARVEDSEWMNTHEAQLVPLLADSTLPVGSKHHLRANIDGILSKLSPGNAEVITVLFGLEADPFPEARGAESTRIRGEDYAINAEDLAVRLGLAKPSDSLRTKQRKAKLAVDRATSAFRVEARDQGFRSIADSSRGWNRMISPDRVKIDVPAGPTHRELSDRFGGAKRVSMYLAAVRAGKGAETAKKLERWNAGKLSVKERDKLISAYHEQRDRDRLRQFHMQTATQTIDPATLPAHKPGTPSEASHLYVGEILAGAARALVNGVKRPAKPGKPLGSRAWDDARFHKFMGRARQYEASRAREQGGDNE